MRQLRHLVILASTAAALFCSNASAQSLDDFQRQVLTLTEHQQLLEALEIAEEGLRRFPDAPELLLQKGALLLKLGRVDEGRRALDAALQISPGDARILSKTAESEMRQGRLDQAVALFRRALEKGGTDGGAQYQLAYTLFLKGDDDVALRAARAAVAADPLRPSYRLFLASLSSLRRRPEESHRELLAAYRLAPDDPAPLYRLSYSFESRSNLGQALEMAELAQLLDPENPLYQRRLSDLFRAAGEEELSRRWESRAAEFERAFLIYGRALRLARQNRLQESTLLLQEVTSKHPEFLSGWTLLAQIQQKRGLDQEALSAYLAALRQKPDQPQAREAGAFIHLRRGALEEAMELLGPESSPELNSGLVQGYHLMLEHRWLEALDLFRRLREKNPLSVELIRLMSFCAGELGLPEQALELLQTAQSLQPENTELSEMNRRLRFDRAMQRMNAGDYAGAAAGFQELAQDSPQDADVRLHLAYSLQQAGKLAQAVEQYSAGLNQAAGETWARTNLAATLYRLERYDEAVVQWSILARGSNRPEALKQIGLCYSRLGRDQEAEAVFAQAVAESPTPELIYNLGITRLRLLQTEAAWKLLREAARQGYPPAVKLVRQYLKR